MSAWVFTIFFAMPEYKVSVVIPTKNREKEVVRAIDSVYHQTVRPVEVVVVDDASGDNTTGIIRRQFPDVILISNKTSIGGAAARNIGADAATGEYIAFLDSDDEWLPDHLENALKVITERQADGVYGRFAIVRENVSSTVDFLVESPQKGKIGDYIFSFRRFDARTSTFVFRRSAFSKVRFDDRLRKHQDWDLAINFDQRFVFVLDPHPSVKIHVKGENGRMSNTLNHEATFYFLEKNSGYISPDNIFAFCVKQIMRCQRIGERREVIDRYTGFTEAYFSRLSWKNKVILVLIKKRLLNIGYVYKLKNLFS